MTKIYKGYWDSLILWTRPIGMLTCKRDRFAWKETQRLLGIAFLGLKRPRKAIENSLSRSLFTHMGLFCRPKWDLERLLRPQLGRPGAHCIHRSNVYEMRPMDLKRDLLKNKRPKHMKRNLSKRLMYMKRNVWNWKETYVYEKRPMKETHPVWK